MNLLKQNLINNHIENQVSMNINHFIDKIIELTRLNKLFYCLKNVKLTILNNRL